MKQARIIKCMDGLAWMTSCGISPFEDVKNFQYDDQVSSTENKPGRGTNSYHTIISKNTACPEQKLKDILKPKLITDGYRIYTPIFF